MDVPAAFRPKTPGRTFTLRLREQPLATSAIVATLTTMELCDKFGIGNGTLLASVYGRLSGWSLLRLIDGRLGWLAPEDSGKFMSLERMMTKLEATYLPSDWNRRLFVDPASPETVEVPGGRGSATSPRGNVEPRRTRCTPLRIARSRRSRGSLKTDT